MDDAASFVILLGESLVQTSKKVLITGVLGQDGSYLAEAALAEGCQVFGGVRGQLNDDRLWRLRHLGIAEDVEFVRMDLQDPVSIDSVLRQVEPDLVFNFAAQSSVGDSFLDPVKTAEAGGMGALRIFEYARARGMSTKIFQASSSEIFGDITDTHHSEESFFNPKTPYGATKLFAHIMAEAYRASYRAHVSTGILFNHESPLRGDNFVTKKITASMVAVKKGKIDSFSLGNLDARRDWSHAKDFIRAIWDLMALSAPDNVVLASGRLNSVREFVDLTAAALDIDLFWDGVGTNEVGIDVKTGKVVVSVNPAFYRPYDPAQPLADIKKAKSLLGWQPEYSLADLVEEMVRFDFDRIQ